MPRGEGHGVMQGQPDVINACTDLDQVRREALEFAHIGLYRFRFDGRLVFMDQGALRIFELDDRIDTPDAISRYCMDDIIEYVTPKGAMRREIRERGRLRNREWSFKTLKGNLKCVTEDSYLVQDATGEEFIQVLVRDITEQRRAQEALRASEERYRNILESIQEGYYEVDLEGSFTFFNKAMGVILGYDEVEMKGLNYRAYYHDETAIRRAFKTYRDVYQTGEAVQVIDWRVRRKDGSEAILEVSISLMRNAEGAPTGFRGIVRDLTERRTAERRLLEAEARYRELFENANDILYTHDLCGRITSVNKLGERVSGYSHEELIGKSILELVAPECRESAEDMLKRKLAGIETTTRYESLLLSKSGERVPIEVSTRLILENGVPAGIQGNVRDITERVRAEEEKKRLHAQILHTQKLESLGVLAGGIAHDFNNLLVGVLGNAGLALSRMPEDAPARPYVQRIETAAQRAAGLTNQMLAYAGKGAFVVRPVDLSSLAREMSQLLAASISKSASLTYDCPAGLPMIRGDIAQLHQVIINLVINASDAIGETVGAIAIRTYERDLDRGQLAKLYVQDELEPGLYICFEVRDTGCGMDNDTLSRIFDPFFSTKFAGRGLGLAAVLGIVRSHRGAIAVSSEPGKGTTFRIFFPAEASAAPIPQPQPPVRAETDAWRGHGYILIVDDEPQVLEVARETLVRRGFDVLCAENGLSGVRIFAEYMHEIALVLLDLTMPGLDGWQTIERIRGLRSDVPIILSSGYGEQVAIEGRQPDGPNAFIQKPYSPADLIRIVRAALFPRGK